VDHWDRRSPQYGRRECLMRCLRGTWRRERSSAFTLEKNRVQKYSPPDSKPAPPRTSPGCDWPPSAQPLRYIEGSTRGDFLKTRRTAGPNTRLELWQNCPGCRVLGPSGHRGCSGCFVMDSAASPHDPDHVSRNQHGLALACGPLFNHTLHCGNSVLPGTTRSKLLTSTTRSMRSIA